MTSLPGRFCITIEGVRYRVTRRHNVTPGSLPYLLAEMLTGREMDLTTFEAFGLRVTVEPCTDQGDDQPDPLADGRYG